MSQVCRFYQKGYCRFGNSCHYLHDGDYSNHNSKTYKDYSHNTYSKNNSDYSHNSYSRNNADYSHNSYSRNNADYSHNSYSRNNADYSHNSYSRNNADYSHNSYSRNNADYSHNNYSRNNAADYSYNSYSKSNADYSQNSYSKSNADNSYNSSHSKGNYNRYHVDNRQRDSKSSDSLTLPQYVTIVKNEVKQFEERHVWPFTVMAPLSGCGNMPVLKDHSPEEIRYQYHLASSNNSLHDFKQSFDQMMATVKNFCYTIKSNSNNETFNIVKSLLAKEDLQQEEMTTESAFSSSSAATSSFTFDLNALQSANSAAAAGFNTNPNSVFNNVSAPATSVFAPQGTSELMESAEPINFGAALQPESQMSSFSFDLKNLNSDQTAQPVGLAMSSSVFGGANMAPKSEMPNNPNYSVISELKPEYLEAFRTKNFKFGSLPLDPPPKELCY